MKGVFMGKKNKSMIFVLIALSAGMIVFFSPSDISLFADEKNPTKGEAMKLPEPKFSSKTSVEEALLKRRSVRDYKEDSLSLGQISQLLWAAQGVTEKWGGRTAPSAGALYPLEIYLVVGKVKELEPGLYHYDPEKHAVSQKKEGDLREKLTQASLGQDEILRAPATLVITAVYERTQKKYHQRGVQYVHMEVGSAGENIYLQAESLGLGTVFIGAFEDEEVKKALEISEEPLGIMPVGKK
jgi:SagB-type dehydrogenase family enzyme